MMQMTKQTSSSQESHSDVILYPEYVVKKGLMETGDIDKEAVLKVLDLYGKSVQKKLLENKGYCITMERWPLKIDKKLLMLSLKFSTNKSFTEPILELILDTRDGTINKRPVTVEATKELETSMANMSIHKRYEFPKV